MGINQVIDIEEAEIFIDCNINWIDYGRLGNVA